MELSQKQDEEVKRIINITGTVIYLRRRLLKLLNMHTKGIKKVRRKNLKELILMKILKISYRVVK